MLSPHKLEGTPNRAQRRRVPKRWVLRKTLNWLRFDHITNAYHRVWLVDLLCVSLLQAAFVCCLFEALWYRSIARPG